MKDGDFTWLILRAMPRTLPRLAAAALLLAATIAQAATGVPLRLIAINDFHGNLEPANLSLALPDPDDATKTLRVAAGGAPALAGLVHALRDGAPHSLVLSAGDLFGASPLVSTLFRHDSTIQVMNAIGLELDALGNHEFDAGVAELQRAGTAAKFPFLAANVVDAASGRPPFAPYVIKRYGGIRVGIIGAVTKSTPGIVVPSGVAGLRFVDEAEAVNRAARELKRQGVEAIVAVFHEGGEQRGDWNDERCPGAHGPIFDIARRLAPEISVIFSGHTHQGYRCMVDGRLITQGTSYGRGISVVDVVLDPKTQAIDARHTRSINLPVLNERSDAAARERLIAATPAPYADALRAAKPDAAVAQQVARYAAEVAPKAQAPVGRITARFTRGAHGDGDSAAGRLIADAQLAATREASQGGAQIALMNPGGIRSDLDCNGAPPCTVTYGQLFTMQPFGNSLVVLSLSGAQLKALLEAQQRRSDGEPRFMQPSEGFGYAWQADAPAGERVREMRLNGEPIAPTQRLRVTVNSFLAEGGDGFTVLREAGERIGGPQDLEAMLAYLKAHPLLAPSTEARIRRR